MKHTVLGRLSTKEKLMQKWPVLAWMPWTLMLRSRRIHHNRLRQPNLQLEEVLELDEVLGKDKLLKQELDHEKTTEVASEAIIANINVLMKMMVMMVMVVMMMLHPSRRMNVATAGKI